MRSRQTTQPSLVIPGQSVQSGEDALRLTCRVRLASFREASLLLDGIVQINILQLQQGVNPVLHALRSGRLKYLGEDPTETWRTLRDIWEHGGGDCEDLAAALAAERTLQGKPSRVAFIRIRGGLVHAVTEDLRTRERLDPSRTGGMTI